MAMEYGGPRCAKYTLYFVNIIIVILACVTLGVGIWLSTTVSGFVSSVNPDVDPSGMGMTSVTATINGGVSRIQTVANILITTGVFALLIGFLGIWASYKDSETFLITYGVVMIVIVLLEMGAGIAWSLDENKIIAEYTADFNAAIPLYDYIDTTVDSNNRITVLAGQRFNNATATSTALINTIQTWVGCCGAENGYMDFAQATLYWSKARQTAPVYCCKLSNIRQLTLEDPSCGTTRTTNNSYMNVGCTQKMSNWIHNNSGMIIGVAVGIAIINILGIIAAFYHYYCLTQGYKEF